MTTITNHCNKNDHDDYNGDDNDDDDKEQEAAPVSHHCVFTRAECPTTKRVTEHKNTNAASMATIIIMGLEHKWSYWCRISASGSSSVSLYMWPVGPACLVIMTVVSKKFKPLDDDEAVEDDDEDVN